MTPTRLSSSVSIYYYVVHDDAQAATWKEIYRVRQNKVAPSIFCGFLSNRLEFQRNI